MTEKAVGYFLIIAGLSLMITATLSVYSVFTGGALPFPLFNFKGISIPLGESLPEVEVFPAEVLNSTTNTLAHLFLMGFLVSTGAQIATLGINLARQIVVKVDRKLPSTTNTNEK